MTTPPRLLAALLTATALGLGACGSDGPAEPSPNVVVVLVDTLRAQNVSAYGYERQTTPELDAFGRRSYLFRDARAQAPCTFPSANSILTGKHPAHFFGHPEGFMGIPDDTPALAEILREAGYATIAVSASPIVRKSPTNFNPRGGFAQGFDLFEERCLWKPAACVNEHAITYLDLVREPFFLYLHYMDPHDPLQLPDDWPRRFARQKYEGKWFVEKGLLTPIAKVLYGPEERIPVNDRDLRHLIDLYDEEIAYFDDQFGRLIHALEQRALFEDTLVIVVADHGEEFLEHRHIKHCHSLYDTEVKTPFVVKIPGQTEGREIDAQVANLSVPPTILDYAGLDPAAYGMAGESLRSLVNEGDEPGPVVISWGKLRAIKQGRFKLILNVKTDEMELYDLTADPGETVDVQAEHPGVVRELRGRIRSWIRATGESQRGQAERSEKTQERLKALGYLQ